MFLKMVRFGERGPKIKGLESERGVWGTIIITPSDWEGGEAREGAGRKRAAFAPRWPLAREEARDHIKRRASCARRPRQKDGERLDGGTGRVA